MLLFLYLFYLCEGTLRTRAELSEFILPYLVVEVLVFSDSPRDSVREIALEICSVLSIFRNEDDDQETGGGGRRGAGREEGGVLERVARSGFSAEGSVGGRGSSSNRMAVQSVFRLLDTLQYWVDSGARGTFSRTNEDHSMQPYFQCWDKPSELLSALLNQVPKVLLARAAMNVDAQARALRYFEQHARDIQRNSDAQSTAASSDATTFACSPSSSSGDGGGIRDLEAAKRQYFSLLPDINTQLPPLTTFLADDLMECFARLEDSDSLEGVVKLRRGCELTPSFFSRICVLEHTDKHPEALQEYDSLRDSLSLQAPNSRFHSPTPGPDSGCVRGQGRRGGDTSFQMCYTERGRVRCLKEMGQLHAVLDQVLGEEAEEPMGTQEAGSLVVECAVLPTAIEAAWE